MRNFKRKTTKMIKKIVSISIIFVMTMAILAGFARPTEAAYDSLTFGSAVATGIEDITISSGGEVEALAVAATTIDITMAVGSSITFTSATGKVMTLDNDAAGTNTCAAGGTSSLTVAYIPGDATVQLSLTGATCTTYALSEANVKATPLTAATASAYTVTFKTATALSSGDKIRLDFGTGFTVADNTTASNVTTLTDDGTDISSGISLAAVSATKRVTITLASAVAANSVVNIVLNSALVTNPSTASADTAVSGLDLYTTDSGDTTVDSLLNQTAFNRVISLVSGWNVFAPSQTLESATLATVMLPIVDTYSAIYELAWDSDTSTMTWQTPTTINPLYGYAIYNNSGSTQSLPLDFAKEEVSNATFSRNLDNKGWQLMGYTGTSASLVAQTYCLDGLSSGGSDYFSTIVDLTGTTAGSTPSSHAINSSTTSEASGGSTMLFAKDYGYAVFTTANSLVLGGEREE